MVGQEPQETVAVGGVEIEEFATPAEAESLEPIAEVAEEVVVEEQPVEDVPEAAVEPVAVEAGEDETAA